MTNPYEKAASMERDNSMTRRFLADAGIGPGMRVVEIGCGGGEVTQLLAELVGQSGRIVAIDREPGALAIARQRMRERHMEHVQFVQCDLTAPAAALTAYAPGSFDALAGRRVLMYLPQPAATLRHLANWLRSGACIVFEETDTTLVPGRISPMPAHDRAATWMRSMLLAEGANVHMGFALPATLVQAGFAFERIRAEAVIQGQGTQFPLSALLKLMTPRIVLHGVATESEIEAAAQEIDAEANDPTVVYVSAVAFCATARMP